MPAPSGPLRSTLGAVLSILALATSQQASPARFTQVVSVALDRPLELTVSLPRGQVEVFHGREERVTIAVSAQTHDGQPLDESLIAASLAIEQIGNKVRLGYIAMPALELTDPRLSYRIDVPHWSQVTSFVGVGTLTIVGVMGPVRAKVERGLIRTSYISKEVSAETRSGDMAIGVVGGRVDAVAGRGNISCIRIARGANVVTGDGDIDLTVIGPSEAIVRKGAGKIDVTGTSGALKASTDTGDLRVRATPREDWQLSSQSGNIRVHLPRAAPFEIDAATDSGEIVVKREDIQQPAATVRRLHRQANGGGARIYVRSFSGQITVQ